MMSWIYLGILAVSVLSATLTGRGGALAAAVPTGAQAGVTLCLTMTGSLCLWSGVGQLMERTGLTEGLSRLLQPLLGRIFPSTRRNPALRRDLSANVCANVLGLGNAATPMGIRAAKGMVDPASPQVAGDELCRLVVLNTASIQLIPANVAAVRASLGGAAPFDILPAVWAASLLSAGIGLLAAWGMGKRWPR